MFKMANKCPKNFNKLLQQRTLAETWFCKKKQNVEQNEENEREKNNSINDQNDSDFIESSQDTTESKLRKKVNQTVTRRSMRLSKSEDVNQSQNHNSECDEAPQKMPKHLPRKLKTPISTPKKNHANVSPSISDRKLSISDVCEVNSTVIKEEIDEMMQNVNDFESIEMTHDLSGLIVGEEIIPNELECPTSVIISEANAQNTDESDKQDEQDPLYVDKNEKNRDSHEKENRKRKKRINIKNAKKAKNTINSEQQPLTKEFFRRLGKLCIKLEHTVPPQHKIENCAGSRPLNKKQILLFESYGPLKRGQYTKFEDEIIKTNWTNFCKIHNWNEKWIQPFLTMRHKGNIYYMSSLEERKKFVRFLANGLPWRSLYSVYLRFKNLYDTSIRHSHYTSKEDKKILEYYSKASESGENNTCVELSKILNRKAHSIWQRYQKLKTKYNISSSKVNDSYANDSISEIDSEKEHKKRKRKKETSLNKTFNKDETKKVFKDVKWSFPLVNRFIEKLMEIMSCENLEKLKNQTISDETWKEMENQISIEHIVLENFWNLQLHMQLFCPKPLYLNDLKIDLIQYLYKTITNANSIDWDEVKLNFNGVTSTFLSKLFDHLQKYVKTKLDSTDVKIPEIIEYLFNKHIPELEEKTSDTVLPKLYYKHGRIISFAKGPKKSQCKGTTSDPLSND